MRPRKVQLHLANCCICPNGLAGAFHFPRSFCGSCNVREGTAATIVLLQVMAGIVLAVGVMAMEVFPTKMEKWWKERMKKEIHDWLDRDVNGTIYAEEHADVWRTIAWCEIGVSALYIVLGCGVIVSLIRKMPHPLWYLPWVIMTLILISSAISGLISVIIICTVMKDKVNITLNVAPLVVYILFVMFWIYGYVIVLAHCKIAFKNRRIAKAAEKIKIATALAEMEKNAGHPPEVKVVKSQKKKTEEY